ncbi:MAG: hypothetical protein M1831_006518 [Alyxoria varia]|nr:MAG: hypothetical protein M1831_006518 [Alyxoria varia]
MSVFGGLNRFISRLGADSPSQEGQTRSPFGFQVLKNTNADLPIEPWFDFIIGINGRNVDNPDPNLFATEIRNLAGNSVNLGLWSAKGQRIRQLYAEIPATSPTLGLSLQWTPVSSTEDVWHVLDVTANSPADEAGLLPYGDYVIGSPEGILRGESGLGELVEDYLNRPVRLHVYNHEYNVAREVTITPSRDWGGTGALGCVLGYGALHRIPAPLDEPPQGPGETLFETARLSTDNYTDVAPFAGGAADTAQPDSNNGPPQYLVPAQMNVPPTSAPPKSTSPAAGHGKRGHRAHHHHAPNAGDIDEYFAEGEAKSREQDNASTPKPSSAVAPPPKASGAAKGGEAAGAVGGGGTSGVDGAGDSEAGEKGGDGAQDESAAKPPPPQRSLSGMGTAGAGPARVESPLKNLASAAGGGASKDEKDAEPAQSAADDDID